MKLIDTFRSRGAPHALGLALIAFAVVLADIAIFAGLGAAVLFGGKRSQPA